MLGDAEFEVFGVTYVESAGVAVDAVVKRRGNARRREWEVVRVRDHARHGLVVQVRGQEVRTERCLEVRVPVDMELQPPERRSVGVEVVHQSPSR